MARLTGLPEHICYSMADDIYNRILADGWHTSFRQKDGGKLAMFSVTRKTFRNHLQHLKDHIVNGGSFFMDDETVSYRVNDCIIWFPCGRTPLWNLFEKMGGK